MIERIVEASIRNRFLVLVVAPVLAVAGVYAMLVTPIDSPEAPSAEPNTLSEALAAARQAMDDYDKLQNALVGKLRAAPSDEEREAIERSLGDVESGYRERQNQAARRLLDLVQRFPAAPDAIDALVWIGRYGERPQAGAAMDALIREHFDSDKLGAVCESLAYADRENDLRKLLADSPHSDVRSFACYELAGSLKRQAEANPSDQERLRPEIDALLEQLADKYAEVGHPSWKRPLGELARNELFERRNLVVGTLAPEIEGDDADGRRFKLSAYRGRVVLINFWGYG